MFTGIITDIGQITAIRKTDEGAAFCVQCSYEAEDIELGESIAHDGICLTVTEVEDACNGAIFTTEASSHTLQLTTAGGWQTGARINLERALRASDRLGGHIVSGHVDGICDVISAQEDGTHRDVHFSCNAELGKFIAYKGSVAINGVSLTVNSVRDEGECTIFSVHLIEHTLQNTTLHMLANGSTANLEIDTVARYIMRARNADDRP